MLLTVIGFDRNRPKTIFFNRQYETSQPGVHTLEFPMPLTPQELTVDFINDSGDDTWFKVFELQVNDLRERQQVISDDEREFDEFFDWFALNAHYLPHGMYWSKNKKFNIEYVDQIIDEEQGPLTTPARTDHWSPTATIQIASRYIKGLSVPNLVTIGKHEWTHWKFDTHDETTADVNAIDKVLDRGFSKTETLYAFTRVFKDGPETNRRIDINSNYIKNRQDV